MEYLLVEVMDRLGERAKGLVSFVVGDGFLLPAERVLGVGFGLRVVVPDVEEVLLEVECDGQRGESQWRRLEDCLEVDATFLLQHSISAFIELSLRVQTCSALTGPLTAHYYSVQKVNLSGLQLDS